MHPPAPHAKEDVTITSLLHHFFGQGCGGKETGVTHNKYSNGTMRALIEMYRHVEGLNTPVNVGHKLL